MTTHHIDYDKQNNAAENLIAVCSACNSRANVDRPRWMAFYQHLARAKKHGGGWEEEAF